MDLNNFNPDPPQQSSQQPSQGTKKSGLGVLGPIGAGIDIASGLMGALDSVFGWSAKRQHRYQQQLMDKQQSQWKEQQSILAQQQLDQWNRENEYNDPTNYFKRLMAGADANGFSKAAVLGDMPGGSVGQSATGVTAPGSTSAPGVGGSTLLPFGSTNILGAMRQRAEISNIEAHSDLLRAQAGESTAHTSLMEKQADLVVANERLVNNQALSEESRKALMDAQAAMERLRVDNYQDITDAQLAEVWARVANLEINTSNAEKEGKYIEEQAQVQLRKMKSEIAVNYALRLVHKAVAKKTGTETTGLAWDNMLKQGTTQNLIAKLEKEMQYYDVKELSAIFDKPQMVIAAMADPDGDGKSGFDAFDGALQELVDELSK